MECNFNRRDKIKQRQRVIQVERIIPEYTSSIHVVLAYVCLITQY